MLKVTVMMMTTTMMMILLDIVMNKTAVEAASGSTERIDGIRRQVSRLSDLGKLAIRLFIRLLFEFFF